MCSEVTVSSKLYFMAEVPTRPKSLLMDQETHKRETRKEGEGRQLRALLAVGEAESRGGVGEKGTVEGGERASEEGQRIKKMEPG